MPEPLEQVTSIQNSQVQSTRTPIQHQKAKKRVNFNKLMLSTYFRIALTFLLMILLFMTASFIAFQSEQKRKALQEYEVQIPDAEIIVPEEKGPSTENWKSYTDKTINFSLRYPPEVSLLEPNQNPVNEIALGVIIDKVDEIDFKQPTNLGYDSTTSKQDRESLKKGEYGNTVDFDNSLSREVVNLGKLNGKSFTVLGRFDTCDYEFERKIIFYLGEYRVILTLYGPEEIIREESKEYFSNKGCGGVAGWDYNNNAQERFSGLLISGNAPKTAQEWYNTFDQILSTFQFTQ